MKAKILLHPELQKFSPDVNVEEPIHALPSRVINEFFFEKFGSPPAIASLSYPRVFAVVLSDTIEFFIKKLKLFPNNLQSPPTWDEDGYIESGEWISPNGGLILSITTYNNVTSFKVLSPTQKKSAQLLRLISSRIHRSIRGKILNLAGPKVLLSPEDIKDFPSWDELAPSLSKEIVSRITSVVLPFFQRAKRLEECGVPSQLGILLYGKPGTGKTYILKALAKKLYGQATIVYIPSDILSEHSFAIRKVFAFIESLTPVVVIMEDIELITTSRVKRTDSIIQTMLELMSGVIRINKGSRMFITTTNLFEDIDEAFKRPGRFDELWEMTPPSQHYASITLQKYFREAGQTVPESWIEFLSTKKLTFAELRFAANEVIRKVLFNDESKKVLGKEDLEAICRMAQRGASTSEFRGFQSSVKRDEKLMEDFDYYIEPETEGF